MKIAIQGHPTRGKEVIQIFKDLGTEGLKDHTGSHIDWIYLRDDSLRPNQLIVGTDVAFLKGYNYKVYTLEEFEKEFPFKIGDEVMFPIKTGWASGKVTGLTYVEDQLKYEVDTRIGGYRYVEPHKLGLYPMKEERNITLTLDKAKEWYKKGGELREIALQAFTEKELNPLPKSWEEYCMTYGCVCLSARYTNISTKYDALIKLEQLRDCWRQGWKPNWNSGIQPKYCVYYYRRKFDIAVLYETSHFLSFPTKEMAEEFLKCFKDLIEKAGDLI